MSARRFPLAPDDPRHGTVNGYVNRRCRCDACRAAWTARCKELRRTRTERREGRAAAHVLSVVEPQHGTASTYFNHSCRCDDCRRAKREYDAGLRQRQRSTPQPSSSRTAALGSPPGQQQRRGLTAAREDSNQ